MICTRPGWSPRAASTLATISSLRMWLLAMCSMVGPAAPANLGGTLAHAVTQRLGKSRVVEDADLPRRKKGRHSLRVASPRQRAGDDNPVVAGQHPREPFAVTLRQWPLQAGLPLP